MKRQMKQDDAGPRAVVHQWLSEPPPRDVAAAIDRLARSDDVQHIAIMPDVHLSHDVCVGTALATTNLLYPNAVGGDIGCGLAVIAFNASSESLKRESRSTALLAELTSRVPTNRHHRGNMAGSLPAEIVESTLSDARLQRLSSRDGLVQFGTLGRGNHFLEFQQDETDRLWLMVHSGSRAMGQAIRDLHIERAAKVRGGLKALDATTAAGAAYLNDMAWARVYAAANRRAMIDAAADILRRTFTIDADAATFRDVDHNHVQSETHGDRELWVHRKGASDAHSGREVFIPGSMGTATYHAVGRGEVKALCSSSHGAGRSMSRDEARRHVSERDVERSLRNVTFDHRMIRSLREESPRAYKDIHVVMRAQRELVKITRRLEPVLSYKGA